MLEKLLIPADALALNHNTTKQQNFSNELTPKVVFLKFKLSLDNFLPSSRCRLAESNGRPVEYHPRLINCRDFKLIDWKQEELIIFIISTSGNGKETK